jgi:hypothetical protein
MSHTLNDDRFYFWIYKLIRVLINKKTIIISCLCLYSLSFFMCTNRPFLIYNRASDHLRSFPIRWNTAVIQSLPKGRNTIKNGRLQPGLSNLSIFKTLLSVNENIDDAVHLYNCISEVKIHKLVEREYKYFLHPRCLTEISIFRKFELPFIEKEIKRLN